MLDNTSPETKWSDPENPLIIGTGALIGTSAPGACRTNIDTINVFNNAKGSANLGGHFSPELKYSGFDQVIITGKSEKPVYLWISDLKAEIRDANHLWGKNIYETEYRVKGCDGVYRHFLTRGVPVFKKDGSIREWVGTCIDITERKKAEEELKKKIRDLELFSKTTTERELRMIELKKEIDSLLKELGRPKKYS